MECGRCTELLERSSTAARVANTPAAHRWPLPWPQAQQPEPAPGTQWQALLGWLRRPEVERVVLLFENAEEAVVVEVHCLPCASGRPVLLATLPPEEPV
jgi:hypothetical protein